jgi:hypothetical protein
MSRSIVAAWLVASLVVAAAAAHPPGTTIGRAALALREVPVTYEPGALVSELEAEGLLRLADDRVRVALLPAAVLGDLPGGGASAVAAEIARDAALDGTLVVLTGGQLGAWSSEIKAGRLAALVRNVEATAGNASRAAAVEMLVRHVKAEPKPRRPPWTLITVVGSIALLVALFALGRARRPAPPERSRRP